MDHLYINELAVETIIGIHDWEKSHKQTLYLSLQLGFDLISAAQTDTIDDTIDYAALCQCIENYLRNERFQLIETLAQSVANLLFSHYPILWLRLKVSKPQAIPQAKDVGVVIEREKP